MVHFHKASKRLKRERYLIESFFLQISFYSHDQVAKVIHPVSTIPLASKHRVSQIQLHPTLPYLAVQSHDRSVEIFRIRSDEEVQKKQARRRKRTKEKKQQEKNRATYPKMDEPGIDSENEETMESNIVDYFTPHLVVRASGKIRSFDFGSSNPTTKVAMQVC